MKTAVLFFSVTFLMTFSTAFASGEFQRSCNQLLSAPSVYPELKALLSKTEFSSPRGQQIVQKIISHTDVIYNNSGLLIPQKATCLAHNLEAASQYESFLSSLVKNSETGVLCESVIAYELVQKQLSLGRTLADADAAAIMAAERCGLVGPTIAAHVRKMQTSGKRTRPVCL